MQSVNKRYLICQKPTQERPIAKRFSQDIFPSSVGIEDKGSENLRDEQEKSEKFAFFSLVDARKRATI